MVAQSPEPGAHVLNVRAFRIELEFRSVGFFLTRTRKLERLQERGLRAVFKDNNSSYEQLLEKADLPTLNKW